MSLNRRRYDREDCKTLIAYSEYCKTDYYEATMYNKSAGGINFESDAEIRSKLPICIIIPARTDGADTPGTYEAYIARVKWYQRGLLGCRYKIGAKLLFQGYLCNTGEVNKDCGACELCENKLFGEVFLTDKPLTLCQNCFKYLGRAIEDCTEESPIWTKLDDQLMESDKRLKWGIKLMKYGRIEEKLETSANKYKTVFDNYPDGLLVADVETKRFMYANPQISRLLNYTEEELSQMGVADIHPQEVLEHVVSEFEAQARGEKQLTTDIPCLRKDGTTIYVDINTLTDIIDGKKCNIGYFRDATPRKRLENELRLKNSILAAQHEASMDGILFVNRDGIMTFFNRRFVEMWDIPSEITESGSAKKALKCVLDKLVRPQAFLERIRHLNDERNEADYEEIALTDGRIFNCYSLPVLSETEEYYGRLWHFLDVTESVKTAEALRLAKQRADAANHAKSEFLANMSHEIRTPMNAILGFVQILEKKISDNQQKRYLTLIHSAGKSLLTLINDILDLSKIEAGKMRLKYEAVRPASIFHEIIGMFSETIEKKGLKFTLETDLNLSVSLLLDEVRFRQILFNLMGNAVKFTESGSVKLTAKTLTHNKTSDTVDFIFTVEDTGIGICKDQQKTIFDMFEQRNGHDDAKHGGTGLGLAITKRLTEMMGGVVSVTSEPNKGSIFTVILKNVRKVKAANDCVEKNSTPTNSVIFDKAVILIADDITSNLILLYSYLEDHSFEIIAAKNGLRAFEMAKERHPDLILMDMKMPVMGGREAAQKIKAHEATRDIPIIAVTAAAMKEDEKEIGSLCDGYLSKPIKKEDLIGEMARFLKYSIKNKTGYSSQN